MAAANTLTEAQAGMSLPTHSAHAVPVYALGMSLSLFLSLSYVLCVLGYLAFPDLPINHAALSIFLPGFELGNWPTFFIGLVESYAYGWYIALVFGSLYNFFATRH